MFIRIGLEGQLLLLSGNSRVDLLQITPLVIFVSPDGVLRLAVHKPNIDNVFHQRLRAFGGVEELQILEPFFSILLLGFGPFDFAPLFSLIHHYFHRIFFGLPLFCPFFLRESPVRVAIDQTIPFGLLLLRGSIFSLDFSLIGPLKFLEQTIFPRPCWFCACRSFALPRKNVPHF